VPEDGMAEHKMEAKELSGSTAIAIGGKGIVFWACLLLLLMFKYCYRFSRQVGQRK